MPKMEQGYFDTLEEIVNMALALQSLPIPEDELMRRLQRKAIDGVYYALDMIFKERVKDTGVFTGLHTDSRKPGVPMSPIIGDAKLAKEHMLRCLRNEKC